MVSPLRCVITLVIPVLVFAPVPAAGQQDTSRGPQAIVARYRTARLATMQATASGEQVEAVLRLLADSVVYEHPQAGARLVGRDAIGAGIRGFLGATRNARFDVLREIVSGPAVAAEERVSFEVQQAGKWQPVSRTQLTIYEVRDNLIVRELQYWAPR